MEHPLYVLSEVMPGGPQAFNYKCYSLVIVIVEWNLIVCRLLMRIS